MRRTPVRRRDLPDGRIGKEDVSQHSPRRNRFLGPEGQNLFGEFEVLREGNLEIPVVIPEQHSVYKMVRTAV